METLGGELEIATRHVAVGPLVVDEEQKLAREWKPKGKLAHPAMQY